MDPVLKWHRGKFSTGPKYDRYKQPGMNEPFSGSGDSGGDARALPLLDGGGLPGLPISYTGHDLLRLHCRTAYRQAMVSC